MEPFTLSQMLFCFLLPNSCIASTELPIKSDERLAKHIVTFKQEAKKYNAKVPNRPVTVIFGPSRSDDAPGRIGYCSIRQGLIVISEEDYVDLSPEDQEALVFHELGHCALGRPHLELCIVYENGRCAKPVSLMYPVFYEGIYGPNREYYVKELFEAL